MYKNVRELYSKLLSIYYNDYNNITDEENKKMGKKYNPKNLLIKAQRFIEKQIELYPKKVLLKE